MKNKIVIIMFVLNLLPPNILFCGDKYIRFHFRYPFKISEEFTMHEIYFIDSINQTKNLRDFRFTRFISSKFYYLKSLINVDSYLKIPEDSKKYIIIHNDSLILYIESLFNFETDSLPKNFFILPSEFIRDTNIFTSSNKIYFGYQSKKKFIATFKNDTADVIIDWIMKDLEIYPSWHGDY